MRRGAILLAPLAALAALALPAEAGTVRLSPLSTGLPSPVGIDYHEQTDSLIVSVNYQSGLPHVFERVNRTTGSRTQFTNARGWFDEVKIAAVYSGNPGGFTFGDLFTGNGVQGQIARITNNGATVINPWVTLPGSGPFDYLRGSLHVDTTGVFGGDLIVTTLEGKVWRVNSSGVPTRLANLNTHLEGLTVVPNDPARYGPMAGKILAGAEDQRALHMIDAAGNITSVKLGFNVEDVDVFGPDSVFYGIDFTNGRVLQAGAADFTGAREGVLLVNEYPAAGQSGLYQLYWDGTQLRLEQLDLTTGSASTSLWEHVTVFRSPIPEPGTLAIAGLAGMGLLGYGWRRRKAKA